MRSDFHRAIKTAESHIKNENWDDAYIMLDVAKTMQPENPYLRAFYERIALLKKEKDKCIS